MPLRKVLRRHVGVAELGIGLDPIAKLPVVGAEALERGRDHLHDDALGVGERSEPRVTHREEYVERLEGVRDLLCGHSRLLGQPLELLLLPVIQIKAAEPPQEDLPEDGIALEVLVRFQFPETSPERRGQEVVLGQDHLPPALQYSFGRRVEEAEIRGDFEDRESRAVLDVEGRLDQVVRSVTHCLTNPCVLLIVRVAVEGVAIHFQRDPEGQLRMLHERGVKTRKSHTEVTLEEDLIVDELVIPKDRGRTLVVGRCLLALTHEGDEGALRRVSEAPDLDGRRIAARGKANLHEPRGQVRGVQLDHRHPERADLLPHLRELFPFRHLSDKEGSARDVEVVHPAVELEDVGVAPVTRLCLGDD